VTFSALLGALGLLIAAEGLVYAVFPAQVKRAISALLALPEEALRRLGFAAAGLGVLLVAAAGAIS
jgi:uncharacterized protein YjeT (DUF2065 family)